MYDLLVGMVEVLGGELDSVVISDFCEYMYYVVLRIKFNGEIVDVDVRLFDVIVIVVICDLLLLIFVNEDVIDEVFIFE